MYSRKSVGARMELGGTPTLTGHSCEDFHQEPLEAIYYWDWYLLVKANYLTWNSWRLKFLKKTSLPNPVKSVEYIKCYSSSSPRPIESPSNSIRCNSQIICSWSRRPATKLEIKMEISLGDQKAYSQVFQKPYQPQKKT